MTDEQYYSAKHALYPRWEQNHEFSEFIRLTLERHNVHPAPWTMALLLNWQMAVEAFTERVDEHKPDDCMKLSKWLVEASLALQESFAKAGTPAPSGPAEIYRQLLASGYEPPTVIECGDKESKPALEAEDKGLQPLVSCREENRTPPLEADSCTSPN